MRQRLIVVLIGAWVALIWSGPGVMHALQPVSLEVTVDRDEVTVGDRITVNVLIRLPATAQPDFSTIGQQLNDAQAEVLFIGLPVERALPGGLKEVRVRYEVAFFRPGPGQIPPLTVGFTTADGSAGTATSAPIAVTVQSVLPSGADTAAVRNLKPQIDLPFDAGVSPRTLTVVGAFVVLTGLLAAVGVWWLWQRNMRVTAPTPVVVSLSPEEAARAELARVASLGLLDTGDYRTYHALLAACVRRYLSDRYGFPAFAMTTMELRTHMEEQGVGRWQARLVTGLLSECDAVNYAGYTPARARAEANLSMAYEIVEMTLDGERPQPAARSS